MEKDKTGGKTENNEIVKITISKEAELRMAEVLERINDGFAAGKVNRQDLASWALKRFAEECNADLINAVREDHFNEFALLESILRRGKEDGKLPPGLSAALKQCIGVDASSRKAPKKPLTKNNINDVVSREGAQNTDNGDA